MNITLYKEDFSDYSWYYVLKEANLIEGEYISNGKHSEIEAIEITNITQSQISSS